MAVPRTPSSISATRSHRSPAFTSRSSPPACLPSIGSKGATFMLFVAIAGRLIYRPSRAGLALMAVMALAVVWTTAAIGYGATHGDYHVLGLIAGMRDFLADPLGQGLGLGGNLSST